MPQVDHTHEVFDDLYPSWELISDCIKGERAIKKKHDTYLPRPNVSDKSTENELRYKQYLTRAVFYNVTARTLSGLVGQVFSKDPMLDVPPLLDPIVEDSDGSGVSLIQQSKCVLGHVLAQGRAGLFVDYPNVEGIATRQDQLEGAIRPNILHYEAAQIINWRSERVGAKNRLTLIVLAETYVDSDDGFKEEIVEQYPGSKIGRWSLSSADLQERGKRHKASSELMEWLKNLLRQAAQGATSNRESLSNLSDGKTMTKLQICRRSMTYQLSTLAHYRNSADYEEACYIDRATHAIHDRA